MFRTLKTLFDGANARAEEHVREQYSIELIEQKIREATRGLQSAKMTLASLKQRERSEARQVAELDGRIADLELRAREALAAGRENLAGEAAEAIAQLENERLIRQRTVERLETRTLRLQARSRPQTDVWSTCAKRDRRQGRAPGWGGCPWWVELDAQGGAGGRDAGGRGPGALRPVRG